MTQLIEINAEEAKRKLSIFRTYFLEIFVIALAAAVIYLFVHQQSLEHEMRNYLINDRGNDLIKIVANTETIQSNNQLLADIKELLAEIKFIIHQKK